MSELKEGVKFDKEKVRYDLIPVEPLLETAIVLTFGSIKYGDRNWEEGMSWSRLIGSITRHLEAFKAGEIYDPESGRHHLAHAICGCMFLIEYNRTHPEFDDRVKFLKEGDGLARFTLDIAQSAKELFQEEKNKITKELKKVRRVRRQKV